MKRLAIAAAGVVVVWIVVLLVLGSVRGDRAADAIADQLGAALHADATVGAHDLALVRGRFEIENLHLLRDDVVGRLAIDVAALECDLLPLGLALADGGCREIDVRGMNMQVSTGALFTLRPPKQAPPRTERVVIDDATLEFAPSAFLPSFGRVAIAIEHAEAGPTAFRTPLSWLFTLRVLRARIDLPAGISMRLGYERGVMAATGSLFGKTPVAVSVDLPNAAGLHDGKEEMAALFAFGQTVAERLVAKRATDWIRSKL